MERNEQELERAFNDCLERMGRGATIQDCLAAHPSLAGELGPLLRTATTLKISLNVNPSEQAKAAGRERLLRQVQADHDRQARQRSGWFSVPWRAWATAGTLGVMLFAGTGFGVVQASGGAVPGEVLYPVKRTVEDARMAMPFQSDQAKARFSAKLAVRRTKEMAVLADHRDAAGLQKLSGDVNRHLERTAELSIGEVGEIKPAESPDRFAAKREVMRQRLLLMRQRLNQDYQVAVDRLQAIAARTPPEARPGVKQAAERLTLHYQAATRKIEAQLQALESGQNPGRPPGPPNLQRPR